MQGPERCWINRWYLYHSELLQVFFFFYCSYPWAVQLLRGVFHLDIIFICWIWVINTKHINTVWAECIIKPVVA